MDQLLLQFFLRFSAASLGNALMLGYRGFAMLFAVVTVLIAIAIESTKEGD